MSIANAAHCSMMGGGGGPPAPIGVNFVECLNNTTCLCHTDNIASQVQPYTISVWANISSSQPSLSEGRTICLTGTTGSLTSGLELGFVYASSIFKLDPFIQGRSYGHTGFSYQPYLDTWHNIVVTFNGSQVKTYVDATIKSTVNGNQSGALTNTKLGLCCLQWFGNMISGGPIGKYANLAYWGKILTTTEISNLALDISHQPTDADHCYDMVISNGRIADIGTLGGWDFTTISDFQNGVYVPPQ